MRTPEPAPTRPRDRHRRSARRAIVSRTAGLALAGALLAIALGAAACGGGKSEAKANTSLPENATTAQVRGGDFRIVVTATGKVAPLREVEVMSKASGEIVEMPYDIGSSVKAGELLVRLDPDDERRNVQKSEAQLLSARARLEKARSDLAMTKSGAAKSATDAEASVSSNEARIREIEARHARQEELFRRKLLSVEELEASASQLEQTRADLARARATLADTKSLVHQISSREQDVSLAQVDVGNAEIALEEARERLAETEVVAPMDGVITERKVEKGQVIVSAFGNVGGGTLLMKISDLSELFLVTAVDETDIGGIEVGQKALISTDAFPGEEFDGVVAHIAPVGLAVSGVVTFDVKVAVRGEGLAKLKPGMTADVTIVRDESPATLWVQSEAVRTEEDGTAYIETFVEGSEPKKVRVETGLTDGLRTEIRGEIAEGDTVLVREDETLSAWERGENAERPMRARMRNPFLKAKPKDEEKKDAGAKPAEKSETGSKPEASKPEKPAANSEGAAKKGE